MRIVPKRAEELLGISVHDAMQEHLALKVSELTASRESAIYEQVSALYESGLFC